jgi:hypothetical protein
MVLKVSNNYPLCNANFSEWHSSFIPVNVILLSVILQNAIGLSLILVSVILQNVILLILILMSIILLHAIVSVIRPSVILQNTTHQSFFLMLFLSIILQIVILLRVILLRSFC